MLKRSLNVKYQPEFKTAFNSFVIIYFSISINFYTHPGTSLAPSWCTGGEVAGICSTDLVLSADFVGNS